MNPLSRQALHLSLLWRDHRGCYDRHLADDCRRLLAGSRPLSASWLDALRTLRKLGPDGGEALRAVDGQPLQTHSRSRLAFLCAFLLELGLEDVAVGYFEAGRRYLAGLTGQNPALNWLAHRELPGAQQPPLARLLRQAADNRAAFTEWVTDPAHRITVIGNGPLEHPPALPEDTSHLVIDFNRPAHGLTLSSATRHAWVRTPNDSVPPRSDQDLDWIVFTGNNSLHQRLDFASLLPGDFAPDKYLFVPGSVWWELVAELEAPPSAGLIMLHWIASLRGGLQGVEVQGFSITPGEQPLNRKPGRHNWQRERDLLRRRGID